jgi:hypothetical protein
MMIEKLKALEIGKDVVALNFWDGKWSVHISSESFNAKFKTRSVRMLDHVYDEHFIVDGNITILCLIKRSEPDPIVREVTL